MNQPKTCGFFYFSLTPNRSFRNVNHSLTQFGVLNLYTYLCSIISERLIKRLILIISTSLIGLRYNTDLYPKSVLMGRGFFNLQAHPVRWQGVNVNAEPWGIRTSLINLRSQRCSYLLTNLETSLTDRE